jgi:UDP-3-O-[3-hydroxymyristoyl] glucosamine N-acyltransferase
VIDRTLGELAEICGAELVGDPRVRIKGPASLAEAEPDDLSFFGHLRYQKELEATRAAAVVVPRGLAVSRPDVARLVADDANAAFELAIRSFDRLPRRPPPGVHPTAVIAPDAELGRDVAIGAYCVVGEGASIGDGAALHAHVVVSRGARIGAGTEIRSHVTLYDGVTIGARCLIHAGAVIGSDGFGFDPVVGAGGLERWAKVPQAGTVVIGDEVEIGANSTVDRGRFRATRIASGAKLDNLVHVGHNVEVGEHALLIAQVGVAGSTRIGRGAVLAGQCGISTHLEIGAGARVGPGSKVFEDLEAGRDYMGFWAMPKPEYLRAVAGFRRLAELEKRVRELERAGRGRSGA